MPGHKGGLGFQDSAIGKEMYENFIKCDITEVEGVDNLHSPQGVIMKAQELLRDYYKSKKSYFLINGSTSGNLAMIFASFNEGDKVLVERNCHRSILNGIILRKLKPVYIKNEIHSKYDAPMSIDMEHLIHTLETIADAKGIIITYPNYYGICTNLEFIIKECKKRNMKVLVDSAHGAHFGVSEGLPESAVRLGADMVVMSAHKTLPSINQAAFLHINNEELINKTDFYVSAFLSTSPSYMMMCSMDYARYYLQEKGRQAYKELLKLALEYRTCINELEHLHIINDSDMDNIDLTRFIVNIEKGYNAQKVYNHLKSCKIQPELCDGRNIVLIFSPFNLEKDFQKVYEALRSCNFQGMKEEYIKIISNDLPTKVLDPFEVIEEKKVWILLEDSVGRISGGAIVPYPPGVPVLTLGERVDEQVINVIKYYMKINDTILGIEEGKILVLEDVNE